MSSRDIGQCSKIAWMPKNMHREDSSGVGRYGSLDFFRLKGIYFVITTLMAGYIFLYLAGWLGWLTGGWQGLFFDFWPNPITIPGITTLKFDTDTSYYYLAIINN